MRFWRRLKWWHFCAVVLVAAVGWFIVDDLAGPPGCNYDVRPVNRENCRSVLLKELALLSEPFCKDGDCTADGSETIPTEGVKELRRRLIGWVPAWAVPRLFPVDTELTLTRGSSMDLSWPPSSDGTVLVGDVRHRSGGTLRLCMRTEADCLNASGDRMAGMVRTCSQSVGPGGAARIAVVSGQSQVLRMTCLGPGDCELDLGDGSADLAGETECECVKAEDACK